MAKSALAKSNDKPLLVLRGQIKTPPMSEAARIEAGYYLRLIQKGQTLSMPVSRPMPSIGPACHELRITDENSTWRLIYRLGHNSGPRYLSEENESNATGRYSRLQAPTEEIPNRSGEQAMKKAERKKLEKAGWRVTTVQELLGLSDAENKIVELKVALSMRLKEQRRRRRLSQQSLAKLLGSSQPRVAQIAAGGPNVSMDLLLKALFVTGVTEKELAKVISAPA